MSKELPSSQSSSAEKRILWEVRQRYRIQKPRPTGSLPAATGRVRSAASTSRSHNASRITGRRHPARSSTTAVWLRRSLLLLVIIAGIGGGFFGYRILAAGNRITATERSILGQLKDLLFSQGSSLAGEPDDRINILLLAVGGEGHAGENLADTVMMASFRPSDGKLALLSIPRDLYVQVPGEQYFTKINAIHAHGENIKRDTGPLVLSQVVTDITGQPIHYYGRIDFSAFKQIVDAVGGVDITIPNSFFDYWHKISFSAGTEHMNGERALAYARARYVEGPEGGDFRRAARQQQILLAIQEKIFSVNTAFDFSALNNILGALSDNVRTNMQLWEMKRLYELARTIQHDQVKSQVLTTGPRGVLTGTTEMLNDTPAAVLKPRAGNYSEIQAIAAALLTTDTAVNTEPPPTPSPSPEPAAVAKPSLEIRNGTNITGLAKKESETLTAKGYTVLAVGNAVNRSTATTTVYALTDTYLDSAKEVANLFDATTDSGLPADEPASSADLLIILGQDRGK